MRPFFTRMEWTGPDALPPLCPYGAGRGPSLAKDRINASNSCGAGMPAKLWRAWTQTQGNRFPAKIST
jgi:hypothetical protein